MAFASSSPSSFSPDVVTVLVPRPGKNPDPPGLAPNAVPVVPLGEDPDDVPGDIPRKVPWPPVEVPAGKDLRPTFVASGYEPCSQNFA